MAIITIILYLVALALVGYIGYDIYRKRAFSVSDAIAVLALVITLILAINTGGRSGETVAVAPTDTPMPVEPSQLLPERDEPDSNPTSTSASTQPPPTPAITGNRPILLQTSLDDAEAILNPAIGVGDTAKLADNDFVPGQVGQAAHFDSKGKFVAFPIEQNGAQMINLDQGELEFWYKPNYSPTADDIQHPLIVVGEYYNPPHLILEESDALTFSMVDKDYTYYTVRSEYREALWQAGEWVHIRAVWDTTNVNDALQLYVNDRLIRRAGEGPVTGGWNLRTDPKSNAIFVGASNASTDFIADGAIDDLIIRGPAE